jgi:threonine/homoserine/homoserine lactone efflux protein
VDPGPFVRGVAVGLAIAAPVGPIGALTIRRTLTDGRLPGLVTGLGAASADFVYGAVAAFGITAVSSLLLRGRLVLQLVGGGALVWLGWRAVRTRPAVDAGAARPSLRSAFLTTFLLTLSNPTTVLSFAAVFAGLGLGTTTRGTAGAAAMAVGVFVGSALWWVSLTSLVSVARRAATPRRLAWVNRVSGLVVLGFGVLALASAATG